MYFLFIYLMSVTLFAADGQFPQRPVTLVVHVAPGGDSDFVSRLLAEEAEKALGRRVLVVNRPGGSGSVGMGQVMRSKPDGYTIGYVPVDLVTLPFNGFPKINPGSFSFVVRTHVVPAVVAVAGDSPFKTWGDLLAAAHKNPGAISVANPGSGTMWDLAAKALEQKAGIKLKHVPFDGTGPAMLAVMGHHANVVVAASSEVYQNWRAQKLRVLATMTEAPLPELKGAPTLRSQGIDLVITGWGGLAAPQGVPREVLQTLHNAFRKALESEAVKAAMAKRNLVPAPLNPGEFEKFAETQLESVRSIVQPVEK